MPFSFAAVADGLRALTGSLVPEPLCRPTHLYKNTANVDLKKLKKLIQDGKLVPCFLGAEEAQPTGSEEQRSHCAIVHKLLKKKKQDAGSRAWEQELEACPIWWPTRQMRDVCSSREAVQPD